MDINNFQSVFDANVEEEKAFDTMFGAEEDDELMAVVLGEEADEYDLDMNTIDDNETVKDLEKDLEVGKEIEAPKVDSSETVTAPDEVDSEKDTPGEQIACPVAGVADAVEKKEPDEEKIEDEIDKAENKVDLEEEAFINAILGEETEVEIDYDTAPATDNSDSEDTEAVGDSCKKEGEGCEDGECEDKEKSEVAPDDEAPIVYDGETTPDENMDDTFSDEGEPEDDDDDDDDEDVVDDSCKKENVEEIEDNQSEELTKNDDDEIGLKDKQEDPEVGLESTNLDNIFSEEAADANTTEKEEDEIIQAAEDDTEMTDAEVEELIGDGDDDDELLDSIMGE